MMPMLPHNDLVNEARAASARRVKRVVLLNIAALDIDRHALRVTERVC
jgi:hypothetical protein